ncbi:MAG: peptide chain release factor N(5)-glutamine methyltransferase [Prevotellaceae bacterium]|jgi:release factor glutamine methyltransferase|nr:peptide chain release factor N(5)-glutamine methyltransferase [Prevotellaceae bacterium]
MIIAEAADTVKSKLHQQCNDNEIRLITLMLLKHFWKISETDFYTDKQKKLDEKFDDDFRKSLELLQQNTPVQYVLGTAEFYGLKFSVDKNVLIPRPETEELVDWIIAENKDVQTIIDIGTGSGCIAVALAKNMKNTKIYALDISEKAITKAAQNAENNDVHIDFFCNDILCETNFTPIQFDCIVSNPPYVLESEKSKMKRNVLDFEPHLALFVMDDEPLKFYSAIADFAILHLSDKGKIYVEINENLAKETQNLFRQKGFEYIELRKDLNGKDRMMKVESQKFLKL